MITTKRTALSEKEYETKLNTRIEAQFDTEKTPYYKIEPISTVEPVVFDKPTTRIEAKKDIESVMPTVKKPERKAVPVQKEEIPVVMEEEKHEAVAKLDARTKTIVAMYAIVSFILAAIVLATGLAITGKTAAVASLEGELQAAYNTVLSQQEQIAYLSDEAVVSDSASNLGMVQSGAAEEIELIPLGDEVTYEARTNGFDAFCDFVSSIFGG